jgi:hypothetical protein
LADILKGGNGNYNYFFTTFHPMGLTIFLQITEVVDIWIGYANQKRESETATSLTTVRRTRPAHALTTRLPAA